MSFLLYIIFLLFYLIYQDFFINISENKYRVYSIVIPTILSQEIKNNSRDISKLNESLGNGNFKYVILEKLDAIYGNQPSKVIKDSWNTLTDGAYIIKVMCGGVYLAVAYRINNGDYGAAYVFGYDSSMNPYMLKKSINDVWSEENLVTNNDLYVTNNCQLVGGINTEENNIYMQVRFLDASKNMVKALHLEYKFSTNEYLLNRMINGQWGTPQVVSVSPKL